MTLVLVQGDTAPTIRGALTNDDTGGALDLTGCTVYFQMRKKDDQRYTINGLCTVVSAVGGTVTYALGSNDLNTPGDYLAQFEVHYPDLRVQTTKESILVTVRRQ